MAERSRGIGIGVGIGAIVLVVGGLGGYLFWYAPKQARAASQGLVTGWEQRWLPARACLLGERPASADAREALAVRELATGTLTSPLVDCADPVNGITRKPGPVGSDEVEAAFLDVERAIPAVANAYAMRIGAEPDEIDAALDKLGLTINALDAAHDRLRAAAGLPALDRTVSGPGVVTLHRVDEPAVLSAGGVAVSAHNLGGALAGQVFGERIAGARESFVITGPEPRQARGVASPVDSVTAIPGETWMVAPEGASIAAMPTSAEVDPAAAVAIIPLGRGLIAAGALGDGADRAIVLIPDDSTQAAPQPRFQVATSRDRGARWTITPGPALPPGAEIIQWYSDPVAGSLELKAAHGGAEGPRHLLFRFDAAQPLRVPAPVSLPVHATGLDLRWACRAGGVLWWHDGPRALRLPAAAAAAETLEHQASNARVIDCTADAVLLEVDGAPVTYQRCRAGGECAEVLRGASYAFGRAALRSDGLAVYAAGRGSVIAVWTEGAATPTYHRLPRPFTLRALVVWNAVPHALVHRPDDDAQELHAVALGGS